MDGKWEGISLGYQPGPRAAEGLVGNGEDLGYIQNEMVAEE